MTTTETIRFDYPPVRAPLGSPEHSSEIAAAMQPIRDWVQRNYKILSMIEEGGVVTITYLEQTEAKIFSYRSVMHDADILANRVKEWWKESGKPYVVSYARKNDHFLVRYHKGTRTPASEGVGLALRTAFGNRTATWLEA